jgi:hypothetical protein
MGKMAELRMETVETKLPHRLRLPIWAIGKASNYRSDAEVLRIAAMS